MAGRKDIICDPCRRTITEENDRNRRTSGLLGILAQVRNSRCSSLRTPGRSGENSEAGRVPPRENRPVPGNGKSDRREVRRRPPKGLPNTSGAAAYRSLHGGSDCLSRRGSSRRDGRFKCYESFVTRICRLRYWPEGHSLGESYQEDCGTVASS